MTRLLVPLTIVVALAVPAPGNAHEGTNASLQALDRKLEQRPADVALHVERAELLRRAGHPAEAHAAAERALALDPASRPARLERGLALAGLGQAGQALADLDSFLSTGPASTDALRARAGLRAGEGRLAEAVLDLDAALGGSTDPDLFLRRGALLERLGRREEAARGYEAGLARVGDSVVLRVALVRVELALGRLDQARTRVDEVLARVPVKTEWLLRRAEVEQAAGRPGPAQADRAAALAEAERHLATRSTPAARLGRAEALAALGRRGEALSEVNAVLAKAPRLPRARELHDQLTGGGRDARAAAEAR